MGALVKWLGDDTNGADSVPFQLVRLGQGCLVEELTGQAKRFGSCYWSVEFEEQIHWNLAGSLFEV